MVDTGKIGGVLIDTGKIGVLVDTGKIGEVLDKMSSIKVIATKKPVPRQNHFIATDEKSVLT